MARPVTLSNGRSWKLQKDAIAHFKSMLHKYKDGDRVSDPSDEDDLRALLNRYDRVLPSGQPTKAGPGVLYFSRQLNVGDVWATPSFHVHRTDGTSIDFSFYEAIRAK